MLILYLMEIVQDTNVFVAATHSQNGASAEVLSLPGTRRSGRHGRGPVCGI
jgi:hypothetical protein